MEQISSLIPIEMISKKDKYIYQANCYREMLKEMFIEGGSLELWSLDKSRWGPKLMPHIFATSLYAFKDLIISSLNKDAFNMMIVIFFKFHSKKGIVPSQILKSWTKYKNLRKESKIEKWNTLKNNFLSKGQTTFDIIPGMQQGLLQQTSTVLASIKCYITDYVILVYCKKEKLEIKIKKWCNFR